MRERTDHEEFWAGGFGDAYVERSLGNGIAEATKAFFAKALEKAEAPKSCIELGANVGLNLRALRSLYPEQEQFAVEINGEAVEHLRTLLPSRNVFHGSILEFDPLATYDLVLVKGVLIHLEPTTLGEVYEKIHRASSRYILLGEYYNPTPVEIPYRGHGARLYKRDYCGEILDRFGDLRLLDYGFAYRRDERFAQDDLTWFLMEKCP